MFKAIVFDLDGTLIDSPLCFQTIRRELEIPDGDYILEHLATLPADVQLAKNQKLEEIELKAAAGATLFPGVQKIFAEIKERGMKTGILTRNCRAVTNLVTQNLKIEVDYVVTREDFPAKPDPAGLHHFLKIWGLQSHEMLYVGDFQFDIECGQRAGVKTALFTNGRPVEGDWNPDFTFHHFDDLTRRIIGLNL